MIDTKAIRERFVGVRHVEPYVVPALCDRVDELEAALAAAETRAERLAVYARALKAYDEQLERPTVETTTECWDLGAAVVNAEAALQPGDLGGAETSAP